MIEPDFGHWLAGFIDGEGCFRIHGLSNGSFQPTFSLKQRDDDKALMERIVAETGIGRLYPDTSRNGNSKPCVVWTVSSRSGTAKLVGLLETYPLRGRKGSEFEVWKEAVRFWVNGKRGHRWIGQRDWYPMMVAKEQIQDIKKYAEEVRPPCPQRDFYSATPLF